MKATNVAIYGLGFMAGVVQIARGVEWWLAYQTRRKPWHAARQDLSAIPKPGERTR